MAVLDRGGMTLAKMSGDALFNEDKLTELHQIANGNMEFLNKIAQTYMMQFEAKYPELEQAVDAGDSERVEQLAHLLKGASYSVGLEQTALRFHELEVAGENAHLEGAKVIMADITTQVERFLVEWNAHFEQLT